MRMKTLVYYGPWDLRVEERPMPRAEAPKHVVVRVWHTGICGTDLGIATGRYTARPGVIMGHESVGEVVEVGGEVDDLAVGSAVVINPTYFCDACAMCRTGRENHCMRKRETEAGVSADGLFAEYYLTSREFVYPIPAGADPLTVVLSEPLSCAMTGVNRLTLRPQLRAAVLGAGPMGVLYAALLAQRGLSGVLVESSQARAERVQELGASHWQVVESLSAAVERFQDGRSGPASLDVVVDTTGALLTESLPLLNPGGQLLLVGLSGGTASIDPAWIADNSIQVLGSIDSLGSFGDAVELLARKSLGVERLVTAELPLEEYAEAFSLLGVELADRRRIAPAGHVKVCLSLGEQASQA